MLPDGHSRTLRRGSGGVWSEFSFLSVDNATENVLSPRESPVINLEMMNALLLIKKLHGP